MTETATPNASAPTQEGYHFTNTWFELVKPVWESLIPKVAPSKILEVGSYEGASACYLIETLAQHKPIELHCVDTWEGGVEHKAIQTDMSTVEGRFQANTRRAMDKVRNPVDLVIHKGYSDAQLAKLLASGKQGYFDYVYIDGSHQAPDVLCDAVLGFRLLKVGGILAFDDYIWAENLPYGVDPVRCPKMAVDAFTNIYCRKVRLLQAPLYQVYMQKVAD